MCSALSATYTNTKQHSVAERCEKYDATFMWPWALSHLSIRLPLVRLIRFSRSQTRPVICESTESSHLMVDLDPQGFSHRPYTHSILGALAGTPHTLCVRRRSSASCSCRCRSALIFVRVLHPTKTEEIATTVQNQHISDYIVTHESQSQASYWTSRLLIGSSDQWF